MAKLNEETLDLRTYEDYLDLGKVNTKRYLMLSELIDNSISSFDEEYGEENWGKKLEINIEINSKNSVTKEFNGIEYFNDSWIKVSDNAFGIHEDKLIDALRLNKKNESKKSKMNVHGRGLKQSAFYFGLGVNVISRYKDSKETLMVTNQPIEKGATSNVKYVITKSKEKRDVGTTIEIGPLRKSHRFTQSRLNDVFEALAYRYENLIKNKKMSIKFEYKIEFKNEFTPFEIFKAPNDVAKLSEDFDYPFETRKEIVRVAKKNIEKARVDGKFTPYNDLSKKVEESLKKLMLSNDLSKEFKWEEEIIINEEESVIVDFWYLTRNIESLMPDTKSKRSYSDKRGIRVDEGSRSILHPPIIKNEMSTYLEAMPSTNRSGSVDNRFAGRVNISNFSAQTTTDKSTFEFKNMEDKENFDRQLEVVFDVYELFIIQGRSNNKNSVAAKLTKDDNNKIESVLTSKFRDVVKAVDINENDNNIINITINYNDDDYDLKITINEDHSVRLLSVDVDEKNLVVKSTWFTNHNLWKDINESKNFNVEAMIPTFVLLVLQEMEFESRMKKYKETSGDNNMDDMRPSGSLNYVSKLCQ